MYVCECVRVCMIEKEKKKMCREYNPLHMITTHEKKVSSLSCRFDPSTQLVYSCRRTHAHNS